MSQIDKAQTHKKSQVVKNILATSVAYSKDPLEALSNPEENKLDRTEISGGELFLSNMSEDTKIGKFSAAVFIDHETREITYAIAGTRLNHGKKKAFIDLSDDVKLAIGVTPEKVNAIENLNSKIIDAMMDRAEEQFIKDRMTELTKDTKLSEEEYNKLRKTVERDLPKKELKEAALKGLGGWKINFTGHSLGSVLSDCAAVDMQLRMKSRGMDISKTEISSITFDNPGAITPVKKICKKYKADIAEVRKNIDCKAFCNRENFINSLDEQMGKTYTIVPSSQKPHNSFQRMCTYISRKCKNIPAVRTMFRLLGYGSISRQINEHFLDNFKGVLIDNDGLVRAPDRRLISIEEATTGKEPLLYEASLFKAISEGPQSSAAPKYSMTKPDSNPPERIEFSHTQLENVFETKKQLMEASNLSQTEKPNFREMVVAQRKAREKQYVIRSATDVMNSREIKTNARSITH